MDQINPGLGLCFFDNQLFYAVGDAGRSDKLAHIGSVDFNFDVTDAIITGEEPWFSGIRQAVSQLKQTYSINHIRVLSLPVKECWTVLPKLVYDHPAEREAHIRILMNGTSRNHIHPSWHTLSNPDFKLLLLRNNSALKGFQKLSEKVSTIDYVSEFELGERWIRHANPGGSFMTICCFKNCISVGSYLLGKMRGATWIPFDDPEDLPYLWLQYAAELGWMQGLHEEIYLYGSKVYQIIDILKPFLDDAARLVKMDTLEQMQVEAPEKTYGFNLEQAWPAILLALIY